MLSLKFPKTEQSQTLTFNFVISLQENKYQKLYVPFLPSKNLVCEFFEGGCHGGGRWLWGGLKSGGAAEIGAQRCRHAKMGPEVLARGGRWRSSEPVKGENEWGSKRKNYRRVWGIFDEVRTRSLRHRRGGNDFAGLQASGMDERKREREREEFWEKLKKWGGERERERERGVLNFFGTDRLIPRARFEIFKGKLVFLTFGELSIFETVGLNGRLRSN